MKIGFSSGVVVLAILVMTSSATAQDLEPRSFSQAPVGMNFVSMTYGYSIGEVLFDQAVPITDANGRVNNVVGAYVRTLGFFGASAKVAAIVPYAWGHWHGFLNGDYAGTSRSGFADPRLQLSVNFVGAPAIKMSEMKTYTNNTVVGASLQVVVPVGQYNSEKLINLGQNRWAFRPRLGVSHKTGRWTLEAMGSVWLFTENPDFYGGSAVTQDPLWSVQANVIHSFPSGIWFGVGAGFSRGGKTASDGVYGNTYKKNTRWAALLSYPLARTHSVKVIYIDGLSTRLGSNFDQVSISYLIRWGGEN
ncbi:MAG: transporter [Candidatus Krumholzibacteria bacterium]|nr:transporter [Candidatus Krumholzibacteria bacterium]